MYKIISLLLFIGIISWSFISVDVEMSAKEIVKKANDLTQGLSNEGEMEMIIERETWSRTVSMKTWSLGQKYSMIYITAPARDKGQVFLKRGKDMWNWMPTVSRMIKIPPSMMSQGWMGSDFTNDDLVKVNSIVVDYTHKIIGEEKINGYECYRVELIPLENAAIVWGKVEMWIEKNNFYTLKADYFDEDMKIVNRMLGLDIKDMGGRKLPTRLEMIPMDKEGQKTIMITKKQVFDIDVAPSFFTQQNMKKIR